VDLLLWLLPVVILFVVLSGLFLSKTYDLFVSFSLSLVITLMTFLPYYYLTQLAFGYTRVVEFTIDTYPPEDLKIVPYHGKEAKFICKRFEVRWPKQLNDGIFGSPDQADTCTFYQPLDKERK